MKMFRLQDVIVRSQVPLLTTASLFAYSTDSGYRKWLHTMQHHIARLSIQLIHEHMHVLAFYPMKLLPSHCTTDVMWVWRILLLKLGSCPEVFPWQL